MRSLKLFFILIVTVGCGDGTGETNPNPSNTTNKPGDTTTNDGGSVSPDGAVKVAKGTHFEEVGKEWFLPPNMSPGTVDFIDVNGDGWLDAFLTSAGSSRALGTSDSDAHWRLAVNDGKSFPKNYARYSVPSLSLSALQIMSGTEHVIVSDFDGDSLLDLVSVQKGEIRKGTASGLGGAAQPWDNASIPKELVATMPVDVDGDKIVDFLISYGGTPFSSGGQTFVKVARSRPGGFGPLETWQVPAVTDASTTNFDAKDFDGDGRADLVEIAEPAFRVWKNTGSGFAPPTTFTFPTACYCKTTNQGPTYAIIDLDGDGLLDLVEPADRKAVDDKKSIYLQVWGNAEGKPYWKYYRNEGTAFAAEARQWRLPLRGGPGSAEGFNTVASYVSTTRHWGSFDFNGDGIRDLVYTSDDKLERKVVVYFGAP
jgi:hypothetical protein